jgi:hypothetical protein
MGLFRKFVGFLHEFCTRKFFPKMTPIGLILCEKSIARIPEAWKRFFGLDSIHPPLQGRGGCIEAKIYLFFSEKGVILMCVIDSSHKITSIWMIFSQKSTNFLFSLHYTHPFPESGSSKPFSRFFTRNFFLKMNRMKYGLKETYLLFLRTNIIV